MAMLESTTPSPTDAQQTVVAGAPFVKAVESTLAEIRLSRLSLWVSKSKAAQSRQSGYTALARRHH